MSFRKPMCARCYGNENLIQCWYQLGHGIRTGLVTDTTWEPGIEAAFVCEDCIRRTVLGRIGYALLWTTLGAALLWFSQQITDRGVIRGVVYGAAFLWTGIYTGWFLLFKKRHYWASRIAAEAHLSELKGRDDRLNTWREVEWGRDTNEPSPDSGPRCEICYSTDGLLACRYWVGRRARRHVDHEAPAWREPPRTEYVCTGCLEDNRRSHLRSSSFLLIVAAAIGLSLRSMGSALGDWRNLALVAPVILGAWGVAELLDGLFASLDARALRILAERRSSMLKGQGIEVNEWGAASPMSDAEPVGETRHA